MKYFNKWLFSIITVLFLAACTPYIQITASNVFQGWTQAMALGGRTPVPQAFGLAMTSASVTLGWAAMSGVNIM